MATKYRTTILAIKRSGKNGDRVTLYQRIFYDHRQWQTALGISIPASCYDTKAQIVTGGDGMEHYNYAINRSKEIIRTIMARYDLVEHRAPSFEEVTAEYVSLMKKEGLLRGKDKPKESVLRLSDKIDDFISEESRDKKWSPNTEKPFVTMKHDLDTFEKNRYPLTFEDITKDKLEDFIEYHTVTYNLATATVHKKTKRLKWYLRWCISKGLGVREEIEVFCAKRNVGVEQKKIIYLTWEELQKLKEYEFSPNQAYLERVRDVFLFACYSGMRYSDVRALRPEHVHNGVIEFVVQKTNDLLQVNLNKHTREILEKYSEWSKASGMALPVPSNQKVNVYLHEVCRLCGIDTPTMQIYSTYNEKRKEVWSPKYELITFHAARRTFITHALRLGIPVPVIMKFSGHHSTAMLKPYMQVVDELKEKEMAKFDSM